MIIKNINRHNQKSIIWIQEKLKILCEYLNTDFIPNEKCKGLLKFHMKDVPQKLYKYSNCEDKKLKTLRKNCIWASRGLMFPDKDDLIIEPDRIKLKEAAEKNMELFYLNSLNSILINIKFPTYYIYFYKKECLDENGFLIKENEDFIFKCCAKGVLLYVMIKVLRILRHEYTSEDRYVSFLESLNKYREIANVFCLTERNDNDYMWKNYSDNYKGFCVEYNFQNYDKIELEDTRNLLSLLPVIYSDKKIPFDPSFLLSENKEVVFSDVVSRTNLNLQCYFKNESFSNEEEWRIIFKRDKEYEAKHDNKGQEFFFPFISNIYLGRDIIESHKNTLMDIAKALNVDIYQQYTEESTGKMHFSKIII